MKKALALLLAVVMVFSLTAYAADGADSYNITIDLNGETFATAIVAKTDDSILVNLSILNGEETIDVNISANPEQVKFTIPAYSSDVYVISTELLSQNSGVSVNGSTIDEAALNELLSGDFTMHVMMAGMSVAGAIGGLFSEENLTQAAESYTLPMLDTTLDCVVTTFAPTAEVWKTALEGLINVVNTDSNLDAAINDLCSFIFAQLPAGMLESAEQLAATARSYISQGTEQLSAMVDELSQTLGMLSIKVASDDNGLRSISAEAGDQSVAAFATVTEEDVTTTVASASGMILVSAETVNNDEELSGTVTVPMVGADLSYYFDKTFATTIGLPAGEIYLALASQGLEVDIISDGDDEGSYLGFAIAQGEDVSSVELNIVSSSDEVMAVEGNEIVLESTEDIEAFVNDLEAFMAA